MLVSEEEADLKAGKISTHVTDWQRLVGQEKKETV